MTQFKIGDRVAVYVGGCRYVNPDRKIGVVVSIETLNIQVSFEGLQETWLCHPNQCRKLINKKRREWVLEGIDCSATIGPSTSNHITGPFLKAGEKVTVREVKK